MYAEERQDRVERLVAETGRVSVVDLAREFDVTSETVRRDLAQLEMRGVLRRVHGGAVAASMASRLEESVPSRLGRNADAKERIAAAAMTLIPASFSGSIAIDAGTTTGRLAENLARWRPAAAHQALVVITNSVRIALTVAENPEIEVNLLGGRLRAITSAAVGSTTLAQLARLRPDIAFIGANGVHAEFGLSTPDEEESAVKTALTLGARRAVALVDGTKLGQEALVRFAGLADLDTLITDGSPAPDLSTALESAGVEVTAA